MLNELELQNFREVRMYIRNLNEWKIETSDMNNKRNNYGEELFQRTTKRILINENGIIIIIIEVSWRNKKAKETRT